MLKLEKLSPPYPPLGVRIPKAQEQFTNLPEEALEALQNGEVPFLARYNDEDVGFFTLRPSAHDEVELLRAEDRYTLLSFMVDERFQGQGFGARILAELPELARTTFPQIQSVGLTVNCRNTRAYSLYKKCGFCDNGDLYHHRPLGPQHVMILDISSD